MKREFLYAASLWASLFYLQTIEPMLPPAESTPLLARDGFGYARAYGGIDTFCTRPLLQDGTGGFVAYACLKHGVGLWGLAQKDTHFSDAILSASYATSYIYHKELDFIDTNMRLGLYFSKQTETSIFAYVGQAYGMCQWLDLGWYGELLGSNHGVCGLYAKVDHLLDSLSLQIGEEYHTMHKGSLWSFYMLVEYDFSMHEIAYAPIVQWWYRWNTPSQHNPYEKKRTWDVSFGINGCWEF